MLSDRERRTLARIERHLVESDPELARLFAGGPARRGDPSVPTFLLVAGLAMLVLGSIAGAVPVAVSGMVLSLAALVLATVQPGRARRPGIA